MSISSRMVSKIYVHPRNQFFDLSGRMGHEILLGRNYRWQIQYQEIIRIQQKSFANKMGVTLNSRNRQSPLQGPSATRFRCA